MIKFVVVLSIALRIVVGNAWLLPSHGYANKGGTTGQQAAKNAGNTTLNVRSAKFDTDFNGNLLPTGANEEVLIKSGVGLNNTKFLKIHGDAAGNGTYLAGGVKN